MDLLPQFGLIALLAMAGAAPLSAQASAPDPALVARGDTLYHGPGNCYACHGTKAIGAVGPNLTDAEWIHSKGTYEEIVAQILKGRGLTIARRTVAKYREELGILPSHQRRLAPRKR